MKRFTPDNITTLGPNEIFVFGSNEAGIHGAGAARLAHEEFGAILGVGFGLMGRSFAIPTKDHQIVSLPMGDIQHYIKWFIAFASHESNKHLTFLVTKIGCGLAGFSPGDMAYLLWPAARHDNIILPEEFHRIMAMEGWELGH